VGADYLLAAKANQPTLRVEMESALAEAGAIDVDVDHDKSRGRIEQRSVGVIRDVDWLDGARCFPGELRLPHAAMIILVKSRAELSDRGRCETRYYISSATLSAKQAAQAGRGHWGIENQLHWVLDVVFADDQSSPRKGHGAKNMAVVRHFALNLVRSAPQPEPPRLRKPQRKATKPRRTSIKLRRKFAGWDQRYLV
jgi:predicted transposase YbfD/YdcC